MRRTIQADPVGAIIAPMAAARARRIVDEATKAAKPSRQKVYTKR